MKKTEQKKMVRRIYCAGQKNYVANGILFAVCIFAMLTLIGCLIYRRFGNDWLFISSAIILAGVALWLSFSDNMAFVYYDGESIIIKNFYGRPVRTIAVSSIKKAEVVKIKGGSDTEAYFLLCNEAKDFGGLVSSSDIVKDKSIIYYRVTEDAIDFTKKAYLGKIVDSTNFLMSEAE